MNINFDDNKWQKTVLEVLSTEKDLWIGMEIDESDLYVDSMQISLDTYNNLHLRYWIEINQTISDKNILEFCNQQQYYAFPKVYLDDVTEAPKNSISLDLMIPTDGGVSAEALQKTVELFWLDIIEIESKVSEIGWLEEDRVSEDDFIGGKGEESDDFLDEITTNEDEIEVEEAFGEADDEEDEGFLDAEGELAADDEGEEEFDFYGNNWQKKLLEVLSTEKKLWINIWKDKKLYADPFSISLDKYKKLHLSCWIEINQTISDKNILEFCNQQQYYAFPKVHLDDVTEAPKKGISLDLMIPTDGGVSAEALQKTVELFWLDIIEIESKVSEIGWLEEDRVSEDDFIGGKGEESDDFLDEITTNEDEIEVEEAFGEADDEEDEGFLDAEGELAGDDEGEEEFDFDGNGETDEHEEEHSEIEDKLVSIEDALDDLKAEFAKIMGEEELSGEE